MNTLLAYFKWRSKKTRLLIISIIHLERIADAVTNFEVQMCARGLPRGAYGADDLALHDACSGIRRDFRHVGIEGLRAVAVLDDHIVAIAAVVSA